MNTANLWFCLLARLFVCVCLTVGVYLGSEGYPGNRFTKSPDSRLDVYMITLRLYAL